ncbi:MAG: hypothetical protein IJ615_07935, partial [Bacteroidaceae bacterium]|nr:hypothetical protein [Bacteroidaceae bacterium]
FDGQIHAITDFNLTYNGGRQGLFGQVNGATIKNFSIGGTITANGNGDGDAGVGVIGWAEASTIQNVHSSLIVDATGSGLGSTHVGGVVGSLRESGTTGSTIERCSFSGQMNGGGNMINCFGCVVGYMKDRSVIRNCANYGKLTYSGSAGSAGGILAYTWASQGGKIENCLNFGKIDYNKSGNGGAIVGLLQAYSTSIVSNNYMLDGSASQPYGSKTDSNNTCTIASDAQLASGEVAYRLNGSIGGGENWYQTLGTDSQPTLDSSKPGVYQMTVGSTGYTTYVPEVNVAALPAGVTAYVGQIKGDYLHLEPVTELPAASAVILQADAGRYYYNDTDAARTLGQDNDLKFFTADTPSDGTQFCLAKKDSGVGFYIVNKGVTIPARKAYIEKSGAGVKSFYGLDPGDPDGIGEIKDEELKMNNEVFDLSGRKIVNSNSSNIKSLNSKSLNSKLQRGIYIVGGKKVLYTPLN